MKEFRSVLSKDIGHFKPMSVHDGRLPPSRFRALSRSSGLGVSSSDLPETCVYTAVLFRCR